MNSESPRKKWRTLPRPMSLFSTQSTRSSTLSMKLEAFPATTFDDVLDEDETGDIEAMRRKARQMYMTTTLGQQLEMIKSPLPRASMPVLPSVKLQSPAAASGGDGSSLSVSQINSPTSQQWSSEKRCLVITLICLVLILTIFISMRMSQSMMDTSDTASTRDGTAQTLRPTLAQNISPTINTPSFSIADAPSIFISSEPTRQPLESPTSLPTAIPTNEPSVMPTSRPTSSISPTMDPTSRITDSPSHIPSRDPTVSPSANPTTAGPTSYPTDQPSKQPTTIPSAQPSLLPTLEYPTYYPTVKTRGNDG